jgi:hypothetical protein
VLLEVEWEEKYCQPIVERRVRVYHKADAMGLQTFLRGKFAICAGNGGCFEEVWNKIWAAISRGTEATIKAVAISKTKCAGDVFEDCIKK